MGKCLKWNFSTQHLMESMGQTWNNRRNFIQEIWKQWWTEYNKTNDCPTKQETEHTALFPWHSISRTPRSWQNSGKALNRILLAQYEKLCTKILPLMWSMTCTKTKKRNKQVTTRKIYLRRTYGKGSCRNCLDHFHLQNKGMNIS